MTMGKMFGKTMLIESFTYVGQMFTNTDIQCPSGSTNILVSICTDKVNNPFTATCDKIFYYILFFGGSRTKGSSV